MDIAEILNGAGVLMVGLGLVFTWRKNGSQQKDRDIDFARKQTERDIRLETNQKNIIMRLDNPTNGLSAINKATEDMKNHCAYISTEVTGRVTAAERDIKDLKQKHK
jgi:hypothetical protein